MLAFGADLQGDDGVFFGQGPNVDVVDGGDTVEIGREYGSDFFRGERVWGALNENMAGLFCDTDAGHKHKYRHEHGEDRVNWHPAGFDDDYCGDDGRKRAEQITCDVPERAAQVEVFPVAAMENGKTDEVDQEADHGDAEQERAHDGLGGLQARDAFNQDPDGKGDQGQAIGERGEDTNARETVSACLVGRSGSEFVADPCQRQGGSVGEHVGGVGQEREGAGDDAAGNFDEHESGDQDKGNGDPSAAIGSGCIGMSVTGMAMIAALAMRMGAGMGVGRGRCFCHLRTSNRILMCVNKKSM